MIDTFAFSLQLLSCGKAYGQRCQQSGGNIINDDLLLAGHG